MTLRLPKIQISHAARSICTGFLALSAFSPVQADLLVSAAASLEAPLTQIVAEFEAAHPGIEVALNFGGSNSLARQIENGAPVDIFLSAGSEPVDQLCDLHLVARQSITPILTNTLVLIARSDLPSITSIQGLESPSIRVVAIAEPSTAPAGLYATAALDKMGLIDELRPKFVYAKDVRQVLTWVATGNADAGFVYSSDVSDHVRVVADIPADTHPPIRYVAATIRNSEETEKFLAQFTSPTAQKTFRSHGFRPLDPLPTPP